LRDQIEAYTIDLNHLIEVMEEYEACIKLFIIHHNERVRYWRKVHQEEMEETQDSDSVAQKKGDKNDDDSGKDEAEETDSGSIPKSWTFYSSDLGESTYSSSSNEEETFEDTMSDSTADRSYNVVFDQGAERSIIF
jgi:hypothetical protein